jgi:hypothetical protein
MAHVWNEAEVFPLVVCSIDLHATCIHCTVRTKCLVQDYKLGERMHGQLPYAKDGNKE